MKYRLTLLWTLLLVACASPVGQPPRDDIRTSSDMTDADRRAKVHLELATAYFGRGQSTTALDELKKTLADRPDLPEAYNLRGLIYASLGQMPLADESFQYALKLRPTDADTMHNYGWVLCQRQRYDEADELFDKAIATPQYKGLSRTLLAKGLCQARQNKNIEAEQTLSRSYEIDPSNPATAYSLGEVLYRLGQYDRARFYVKRVNAEPEQSNAQTLWLATRIEHKLGDRIGVNAYGGQLRDRYPQSPEALKFARGAFDE